MQLKSGQQKNLQVSAKVEKFNAVNIMLTLKQVIVLPPGEPYWLKLFEWVKI